MARKTKSRLLWARAVRLNISAWLAKNKGGTWRYDNHGSWWCDDNKRHVSRVALDCMNENSGAGYYLYGDDTPERLYF
jgi:hypothetical protein